MTVDDIIAQYMTLRQRKEDMERKHKESLEKLNIVMDRIEAFLLAKMEEDGVTSYKTDSGTAFKTISDYASVADWDAVLEFVKERGAYHLLERRVNKLSVRNYVEEGDIPPGVNYGTRVDIGIRRPTNRG